MGDEDASGLLIDGDLLLRRDVRRAGIDRNRRQQAPAARVEDQHTAHPIPYTFPQIS